MNKAELINYLKDLREQAHNDIEDMQDEMRREGHRDNYGLILFQRGRLLTIGEIITYLDPTGTEVQNAEGTD